MPRNGENTGRLLIGHGSDSTVLLPLTCFVYDYGIFTDFSCSCTAVLDVFHDRWHLYECRSLLPCKLMQIDGEEMLQDSLKYVSSSIISYDNTWSLFSPRTYILPLARLSHLKLRILHTHVSFYRHK